MKLLLVILLVLACVSAKGSHGDHQKKTYHADYKPMVLKNPTVTITPYFTPDHGLQTTVDMIQEAKSSINIATPSWSSWLSCGFKNETPGGCVGCEVQDLHDKEKFPVFGALLNAIHRGVKVRILINDFEEDLCPGRIDGIQYVAIAGASVRAFATVSFMHIKYIEIDQKKSTVCSINFSKTSFLANREAGLIFENNSPLLDYYRKIFDEDWARGYPFPADESRYSEEELNLIKDTSEYEVDVPAPEEFQCDTKSPTPSPIEITPSDNVMITAFPSPDSALETLMARIKSTKKTLTAFLYQINHQGLCDALIDLHSRGVELKLLLSHYIFGYEDWKSSQVCYRKLYDAGIKLRQTQKDCLTFSHQKYWILDGEELGLSTGNWAPTDFPEGDNVYPPPGQNEEHWRKANRDFNVIVKGSSALNKVFSAVFALDNAQGHSYDPYNSVYDVPAGH